MENISQVWLLILLVYSLLLAISVKINVVAIACLASDQEALIDLKNGLCWFNTFKGIPILEFLGSLVNLQYLNLSNAGLIPSHLGNLSHLQYLDLKIVSMHVENLQCVAGLCLFEISCHRWS